MGGSDYFKYGQTGHINRDCIATTTTTPISDLICFFCNHRGLKKANCSSLAATGPVVAPSPATLQITNGHQGKAVVPVMRSIAFQLIVEDA